MWSKFRLAEVRKNSHVLSTVYIIQPQTGEIIKQRFYRSLVLGYCSVCLLESHRVTDFLFVYKTNYLKAKSNNVFGRFLKLCLL